MFGFASAGYYAHLLLTIALAAGLIFLIARHWAGDLLALAGALLFLTGVPVAQASHSLAVRHYVDGLWLFLLALWLVLRRLQHAPGVHAAEPWLTLLTALAFAAAASAKEIYLPLGLIVLLLPLASWRQRPRGADQYPTAPGPNRGRRR